MIDMNLISQLARVKALFQHRTIVAIVSQPPVDRVDVMIAKRASESRRSEAGAEAYRQIHTSIKLPLRATTQPKDV